jgi:DNA-binding NarL/FixJ family response regulator
MVSSALESSPFNIGDVSASPIRTVPCFVLLDSSYKIVGAEARLDALLRGAGLFERPPQRLPEVIEHAARRLIAAALDDGVAFLEASLSAQRLLVRAGRLVGPSGNYLAVTLERLRTRELLNGVAERFRLSPRELQVLTLVMSGLAKREIATHLMIAESTVGEYFKHLYAKIGVRSRSALFARVLDWPQTAY